MSHQSSGVIVVLQADVSKHVYFMSLFGHDSILHC